MPAEPPSNAPGPRRKPVLIAGTLALLGGALAAAWLVVAGRTEPRPPTPEMMASHAKAHEGELPQLFKLPAFAFNDHKNRATTERAFAGKVVIVDFAFTTCTSVCPLLTAKLRLLQRKLGDPGLAFLTFSVDPSHDTPAALAAYKATWNPSEERWTLLATDPKGLAEVAAGMHVTVEATRDAKDPILHSSSFFLVDGSGNVRGVYNSNDEGELERLVRDARSLLPKSAGERTAALTPPALFSALGCAACHDDHKLAPPLAGIFGKKLALEGGATVEADAAYLRESILKPGVKLTAGYVNLMPSYQNEISEAELEGLIDYLRLLPAPAPAAPVEGPSQRTRPAPATSAPVNPAGSASAAPAPALAVSVLIDPVCQMSVRVIEGTPHATHAGKDYYFCSPGCRTRFAAAPQSYLDAPPAKGM